MWVDDHRYIVCRNEDQATKDAHDREAVDSALREALQRGDKSLIGNHGFGRFVAGSGARWHVDLGWAHLIDDLDRLQEIELTIQDKGYRLRTETRGTNNGFASRPHVRGHWIIGFAIPSTSTSPTSRCSSANWPPPSRAMA